MEQKPLAEILRPTILSDFVGQEHIVGTEGIISKLLKDKDKTNFFPSLILWGPPGCGKTNYCN
jgi:putative ATPase